MDPNATYAEIRALVSAQLYGGQTDPDRLAELFESLDDWLIGGGFLPSAWERES